jgi:histidyl-tRNA synthetase
VLRALDKLAKIGPDRVMEEMEQQAGATRAQAAEVLQLGTLAGTSDEMLQQLDGLLAGSELGQAGVANLRQVLAGTRAAGVPDQRMQLDLSIARGLDYYTGIIFETFLGELPNIGSVCSGGRYDNLAGVYTKQQLPGVGASLGLDRLLAAMEELKLIQPVTTPAEVFVTYFEKDRLGDYLWLASELRARGLRVELYPEPKRLGQQLKYADQRGCRVAVIAGEQELAARTCQLKDLRTGESTQYSLEPDVQQMATAITQLLRGTS